MGSCLCKQLCSDKKVSPKCQEYSDDIQQETLSASLGFMGVCSDPKISIKEQRNIVVLFAPENKSPGEKLVSLLAQRALRVCSCSEGGDTNLEMKAIEQAVALIVLTSQALEQSVHCSKILNYAHQRKVPLIHMAIDPSFQSSAWLRALLVTSQEIFAATDPGSVCLILQELCREGFSTLLGRFDKNSMGSTAYTAEADILYSGGQVSGYYVQNMQWHLMNYSFFALEGGRVRGQGDDAVGAFTVCGHYDLDRNEIAWEKNYIGRHSVFFSGSFTTNEAVLSLKGRWGYSGPMTAEEFFMDISLTEASMQSVSLFKPPWTPRSCPELKVSMRAVILHTKGQEKFARRLCCALIACGVNACCPECDAESMIYEISCSARAVCPIVSREFQASIDCEKALTFAESLGMPLAPILIEDDFTPEGWLEKSCSHKLCARMSQDADNATCIMDVKELKLRISNTVSPYETDKISVKFKGTEVLGYFEQHQHRFSLFFGYVSMVNGVVAGHGHDMIGPFIVVGSYTQSDVKFDVRYLGKGCMRFEGTLRKGKSARVAKGKWQLDAKSGEFRLELPLDQGARRRRRHVMLSYDQKDRDRAEYLALWLRFYGMDVWREPDAAPGGAALADDVGASLTAGVEDAAVVVCLCSDEYLRSTRCAKELTYAHHRSRPVLLARAAGEALPERLGWLESIVRPLRLDTVDLPQLSDGAPDRLNALCDRIRRVTGAWAEVGPCLVPKQEEALFPGGRVSGFYLFKGTRCWTHIPFLSLRAGKIVGHGDDTLGAYVISGSYAVESHVWFVKQYVGQVQVIYDGKLLRKEPDSSSFAIKGVWQQGYYRDEFVLCVGDVAPWLDDGDDLVGWAGDASCAPPGPAAAGAGGRYRGRFDVGDDSESWGAIPGCGLVPWLLAAPPPQAGVHDGDDEFPFPLPARALTPGPFPVSIRFESPVPVPLRAESPVSLAPRKPYRRRPYRSVTPQPC